MRIVLVVVQVVDTLVEVVIQEQAKDLYQDMVALHLPIKSIILHNHIPPFK